MSTCALLRRAASSAASLTMFASSAPARPGVPRAIRSRFTPGAIGILRTCTRRICSRPLRSGMSTTIWRSNRPGRSNAGSRMSGRFVAASRITPSLDSKPSISTSSWFSVCSRSSCPPPSPAPRWRPTASISSMKMMQGACAFPCSNRSRTREAPTPTNISTKSDPDIEKNGRPASRVRDLFEQGKAHAPCIIFIDEIDAVGRHRGAGLGGGHDEREQTLNQLLVEMDGFESNDGVILLAATNRPDILDPALLRPGRFDRQIVVDMPDVKGREQILRVHTRKIPLGTGVNLERIAKGTPGLSGAELSNIVNEAALLAARRNKGAVDMNDLEDAKDKVMLGLERKSMVLSDEERRLTAYHEAGHALVSLKVPGLDPLHKVTIVPRGRALGLTAYLPEEDRHNYTKQYIVGRLAMAYGGRVAEELVFGPEKVTTGAAQDIQQATNIARRMVTQFGMSAVIGPIAVGDREQEIFLGREVVQRREISDRTAQIVDEEVKNILTRAYSEATRIVTERRAALDRLAAALLERETLEREQVEMVIAGRPLPPYVPPAPPARAEGGEPEKEKARGERPSGGILRNPPPEPAGA